LIDTPEATQQCLSHQPEKPDYLHIMPDIMLYFQPANCGKD
jgi:hypothetical protein